MKKNIIYVIGLLSVLLLITGVSALMVENESVPQNTSNEDFSGYTTEVKIAGVSTEDHVKQLAESSKQQLTSDEKVDITLTGPTKNPGQNYA